MNKIILTILFLIALLSNAIAQEYLPVRANPSINLKEGLFHTYEDFLRNKAIPVKDIQTTLDPNKVDFYYLLLKETKIEIQSPDTIASARPIDLWGYFDGNAVFVSHELFFKGVDFAPMRRRDVSDHPWSPINILGTISVVSYTRNFKAELSFWSVGSVDKKNKGEVFFIDMRDGSTHKVTLGNFKIFIKDDEELLQQLDEYKGDKDEKIFVFLKKYNDKHPLKI